MLWQTATHTFDFASRNVVMGILNVTDDSFSDGGKWLDPGRAIDHAREMLAAGAEIIDVGGESTRPGAPPVAEAEELQRVLPVIKELAQNGNCVISVDTRKPAVARAGLAAGAAIINDVSGLRDPAMRDLVRESGAGAIAMHMQGEPRTMQLAPRYDDVIGEVREFFRQTYVTCLACGIAPMCLAFDPGIGFGKTVEHNLTLLRDMESLRFEERPLVLGVSRKSFLGKVLGTAALEDRSWPTVALTSYGAIRGANVLRVHDVRPNVQALRMTEAILRGTEG